MAASAREIAFPPANGTELLTLLAVRDDLAALLTDIKANTGNRIVLDANREQVVLTGVIDTSNGTQAFAAIAAQKHQLASIHLSNTSATNTEVEVRNGTVVIDIFNVPANSPGGTIYAVAPITTVNTALNIRKTVAGAVINATVLAYKAT